MFNIKNKYGYSLEILDSNVFYDYVIVDLNNFFWYVLYDGNDLCF